LTIDLSFSILGSCGDSFVPRLGKLLKLDLLLLLNLLLLFKKKIKVFPFSSFVLVKASFQKNLPLIVRKVKVMSWPCVDING
jgi:hypothetical protein